MNSKKIPYRQNMVWMASAMAAPLARAASGCSWVAALTIGAVTLFICWRLGKCGLELKPWVVLLEGLWASVIVSELLFWAETCWPESGGRKAPALILLILAAWAASAGSGRAARIGCVLAWPVGILLGTVLLPGITSVKLENLVPTWQIPDAGLVPVLLMPLLYGGRGKGSGAGVFACLLAFAGVTAAVAAGVLSPKVSAATEGVFYELSRSVQVMGKAGRFESVAAAGMTLGYFSGVSYLLEIPECVDNRSRMVWAYGVLGGLLYLLDLRIDSRILAVGSILIWVMIPVLWGIKKFFQNPPERA